MRTLLPLRLIAVTWGFTAGEVSAHPASLNPEEAASYVGTNATVCGLIASSNYAAESPAQPTFLDFSKPYPNEPFSALILGNDRAKFGTPEVSLREKRVCVTGAIFLYEGKPQIILHVRSRYRTSEQDWAVTGGVQLSLIRVGLDRPPFEGMV